MITSKKPASIFVTLSFVLFFLSCTSTGSENRNTIQSRPTMEAPTLSNIQKRNNEMNKANEMYEPMRNLALSTKAETVSSMLQGGKTTVYGVILEENRRGVYSTTLGLSDGHSSNYVSKGSTVIGGGGNINSKTQSMFMVGNVKKDMFTDCPQPEKVVLPEEGEVSFIVLSTLGRFNCRLPFSEISDSEWREVYNHGAKLKEALNSATY